MAPNSPKQLHEQYSETSEPNVGHVYFQALGLWPLIEPAGANARPWQAARRPAVVDAEAGLLGAMCLDRGIVVIRTSTAASTSTSASNQHLHLHVYIYIYIYTYLYASLQGEL